MKPIDQWGGNEVAMSNREGTAEHAARMATVIRLRENVTSPTRRPEPRGIDWGVVAAYTFLAAIGWGSVAAFFAAILGG